MLSALELLQLKDYASLMVVTAVVYDYLLTLSTEIDYVWCWPWTRVSALFILVRYFGLCWAIIDVLNGTTFIPGALMVSTATAMLIGWTFVIFYNAADMVMILRVYAMWNRSKTILYCLLIIYFAQFIILVVFAAMFYNPDVYLSAIVAQVGIYSVCNYSWINSQLLFPFCVILLQLVLSIILFVLATSQTLKQSLRMYKATKQWQLNRYMQQFMQDGILYFLGIVFYNVSVLLQSGYISNADTPYVDILTIIYLITICPVMPRFIINTRQLYDRDVRVSEQGVDTGFGAASRPTASENAAVSVIAFADHATRVMEGDVGELEAIRLENLDTDRSAAA